MQGCVLSGVFGSLHVFPGGGACGHEIESAATVIISKLRRRRRRRRRRREVAAEVMVVVRGVGMAEVGGVAESGEEARSMGPGGDERVIGGD